MNDVRIGLLGLGTVGAGVAKILLTRRDMLEERAGGRLTLAAIADADLVRAREGLDRIGWHVPKPKATMFVWAEIPDAFKEMGSLEFSKFLLREAKVAVSPGIGFGEYGDQYVRFALIENEHRTRQAVRGIRKALGAGLVTKLPRAGTG